MSGGRIETLIANLIDRLREIQGSPFNYTLAPEQIQRPVHYWDGDRETVNKLGDLPMILVKSGNGSPSMEVLGVWEESEEIDIQVFMAEEASAEDVNAMIRDIRLAVERDWDGLGVGASPNGWRKFIRDPETGQLTDPILLTLTVSFPQLLGDPDSGT